MRSALFLSLALLPVYAQAQSTRTTTAPAELQARVVAPAAFARSVSATPAPAAATDAPVAGSEVKYVLLGFDDDAVATAPRLIHIVPRALTPSQVEGDNAVKVHLTVNFEGQPENLSIEKSAGPALDKETLDAVRQYRFTPATHNHVPVMSDLVIEVKVHGN